MKQLQRLPSWLYAAMLPCLLCVIFASVLFGGKTLLPADQLNTMFLPYSAEHDSVEVYNHFLTDAISQVYPYKVRLRENWLCGEFASWNPAIFGGHPQYASTSFTPFDPTNFVLLLGRMPEAYHWQMLLKLCIAGVAMWLLLGYFRVQERQIHSALRLLFASAYMLNSLFITTLHHQWVLGVFCWMPLSILFLLRLWGSSSRATMLLNAVLSAIFLALGFLGGSLQTNTIAVIAFAVIGCTAALSRRGLPARNTAAHVLSTKRILFQSLLSIAAIGILAFLLTAFMWLPSLELFLYNFNVRAAGKPFSFLNGLKSLPLLVSFAIPELLGTVRGFDLAKIAQADMNDFTAYIGFAPMLFATLGIVPLWKTSPEMRGFILLIALGIVIPLLTPLYKFLYHRSFILYVFGMVVVGAVAAQNILYGGAADSNEQRAGAISHTSVRRFMRYAVWGMVILWVIVLIGNAIIAWKYDTLLASLRRFVESNIASAQLAAGSKEWMLGRAEHFLAHFALWRNPSFGLALGLPMVVMLLLYQHCGVPATSSHSDSKTRTLLWGLVCITFIQLSMVVYAWLPMIDTVKYPLYPPTPTTEFLRRDTSMFRFIPIFDAASHRVMQPNMNEMYGLATSEGYESVFPLNVSRISSALPQPIPTHHLRLAGLINVKYYVSSARNPLRHPDLRLVDSGATLIYENMHWRPRAYLAYSHRVIEAAEEGKMVAQPDDSTYLAAYAEDTTFTGATVLFWRTPARAIQHNAYSTDNQFAIHHSVQFVAYSNNHVRLHVDSQKEGYLVLADTYYPGWRAFVNGQEQEIMRANYMLRAVVVPEGSSDVEFRFDPPLFRLGILLSAATVLICLGFMVVALVQASGKNRRLFLSGTAEASAVEE